MNRILYLSDVDITVSGGAQESMKILMDELASNFEFYLIGPKGKKINNKHTVLGQYRNFIVRGKSPLTLLKMMKDINKEIKKIKPNIIHVQMPSTLVLINFMSSLGLINKNIKLIYTDRGVYGKYGKITTISIDSFIKKVDKVIVTTFVNKNNYKKSYKYFDAMKSKFKVIYNTAGELFDHYNKGKRNELRDTYKIKEDEYVIGFCGRYNDQKNWPLAKDIIMKLKNNSKYKFLIVLGSDGTKENYIDALEYLGHLKKDLGTHKIIDLINISNKDMAELYYVMDFFILTSKWESFGRTAVEAMARKNIVIGTGVDGLSEVIGRSELLFNSDEEAVKLINELTTSKSKFIKEKAFFYNRYHENFRYKLNVEKHLKVYDEILNN